MEQNLIVELNPDKLKQDKEQFKKFLSVINALEEYSEKELEQANKMEKNFEYFDKKYISKLSFNYKDRITKLKECISHNQNF